MANQDSVMDIVTREDISSLLHTLENKEELDFPQVCDIVSSLVYTWQYCRGEKQLYILKTGEYKGCYHWWIEHEDGAIYDFTKLQFHRDKYLKNYKWDIFKFIEDEAYLSNRDNKDYTKSQVMIPSVRLVKVALNDSIENFKQFVDKCFELKLLYS